MMNLHLLSRRILAVAALLATAFTLISCKSVTSSDTVDYKSSGAVRGPNLSYPPDLITAQADRRYIVQDGTATMSEYNAAAKKSVQMRSNVMTGIPGMHIAKDGERRWLVVEKPATELYPQVKDFWQENGFLLVVDSPSTGIMETDWAENRAKIPQDWIRENILSVISDSGFDSGERDKYKTRLEVTKPGETEIYITQRGAIEQCVRDATQACLSTTWTSRPNDPELEAAFLARLMERLGMTQEQAKAMVAAPLAPKTPKAKFVEEGNKGFIELSVGFDRSWRDVGLALDRSNFTVEDRNRSEGVYFVRYVNAKDVGDSKGFFSNLFSSKDESKLQAKKYQVVVKSTGENSANVFVRDADGKPENTPAGIQLLTILTDQLSR
jgi:outer membrane protein assembly factor BamC